MTAKVFGAAPGIADPWSVASVEFDEAAKVLTVLIDFRPGNRFAVSGHEGLYPVHDTVTKTYRHMNFFQHECVLQVRTPRVKLPNGSMRLVEPDFAGRLSSFTLLFEAFILMLATQMPFAAVARLVSESAYRVMAVCERYVHIALGLAAFSDVTALAIDETSRARGHDYVTLAADALKRRVLFVTEGRDAKTIKELAAYLDDLDCPPEQIDTVSIDMSPAFIKGVSEELPNARSIFDKFHVVWHANAAVAKMRCIEQRTTKSLKGFLEAINGMFQAAKRRARGFTRLSTIKTVIFLIVGKLNFHAINPHARQPT